MLACRWRVTIFRSSDRFALHDLKEILQIIGNFASERVHVCVCVRKASRQSITIVSIKCPLPNAISIEYLCLASGVQSISSKTWVG